MRKFSLLIIVFVLLLVGCDSEKKAAKVSVDINEDKVEEVKVEAAEVAEKEEKSEPKGYVFENNGVTIGMNAEAAPIVEKLGDTKDYFEAESCAFQGLDKVYTYNGYELHTYEKDQVDYVSAIIFLDDSVATKEGIYLYSTLEDVLTAYGDQYTEEFGLYTYELEDSKLSFLVENNEVTSIEYAAITE